MNRLALIATLALFTSVACGQKEPTSTTSNTAPVAATPPPAGNPDTVRKATELLEASAKAYREAASLTDTIDIQIKGPDLDQKQVINIEAGPGRDLRMTLNEFEFTVVGDYLFVEHKEVSEKFFKTKHDGSLAQTMARAFGPNATVPMTVALRESKPGDALINAVLMNMLPGAQIVDMAPSKNPAHAGATDVFLASAEGTAVVTIDSDSKLIKSVTLHRKPAGAPEGFELDASFALSPTIASSLATPIAFDPGTRRAVDNVARLIQVGPGDMSPDFTLVDVNGANVKLSDLKGSAVVLDFWATWCGPCRRALPMLEQFHKYTVESGTPVKVIAVDVWEREQTNEAKKAAATKYWGTQNFTVPLMFDFEGTVAAKFGVQAIPTTVVIGPDGRVAQIHRGASGDMVDMLKRETAELFAPKPAPPAGG